MDAFITRPDPQLALYTYRKTVHRAPMGYESNFFAVMGAIREQ